MRCSPRTLLLAAAVALVCLGAPASAQLPDNLPPCIFSVLALRATQTPACQRAISYVTETLDGAESGDTPSPDDIDREILCKCALKYTPSELRVVDACLAQAVEMYSADLTPEQKEEIEALNLADLQAGCVASALRKGWLCVAEWLRPLAHSS